MTVVLPLFFAMFVDWAGDLFVFTGQQATREG
jgi:hypothetical protein